ncbi:hypothetical protein TNCT_108991 [Trichonephila clavata]|uniref:Uncharacterized protein n=1 Tax=Trichonephila clavata TaxID=2740835 RepID=A0A8X6FSP8_TRICU|nr:hypothetical protein TNCT_108991 [Trichonephila clavata]
MMHFEFLLGSGINHLNIQDIFSETNAMEFQSSGQDPKHRTIVENYVVDETTPAPLVSREEIAKMKTALFFLCATQFTKS